MLDQLSVATNPGYRADSIGLNANTMNDQIINSNGVEIILTRVETNPGEGKDAIAYNTWKIEQENMTEEQADKAIADANNAIGSLQLVSILQAAINSRMRACQLGKDPITGKAGKDVLTMDEKFNAAKSFILDSKWGAVRQGGFGALSKELKNAQDMAAIMKELAMLAIKQNKTAVESARQLEIMRSLGMA